MLRTAAIIVVFLMSSVTLTGSIGTTLEQAAGGTPASQVINPACEAVALVHPELSKMSFCLGSESSEEEMAAEVIASAADVLSTLDSFFGCIEESGAPRYDCRFVLDDTSENLNQLAVTYRTTANDLEQYQQCMAEADTSASQKECNQFIPTNDLVGFGISVNLDQIQAIQDSECIDDSYSLNGNRSDWCGALLADVAATIGMSSDVIGIISVLSARDPCEIISMSSRDLGPGPIMGGACNVPDPCGEGGCEVPDPCENGGCTVPNPCQNGGCDPNNLPVPSLEEICGAISGAGNTRNACNPVEPEEVVEDVLQITWAVIGMVTGLLPDPDELLADVNPCDPEHDEYPITYAPPVYEACDGNLPVDPMQELDGAVRLAVSTVNWVLSQNPCQDLTGPINLPGSLSASMTSSQSTVCGQEQPGDPPDNPTFCNLVGYLLPGGGGPNDCNPMIDEVYQETTCSDYLGDIPSVNCLLNDLPSNLCQDSPFAGIACNALNSCGAWEGEEPPESMSGICETTMGMIAPYASMLDDATGEGSTKEDAGDTNDAQTVNPSDSQLLETLEGDGGWQLSLGPGGLADTPGAFGFISDYPPGTEFVQFPNLIPDHGQISQPASYWGTNTAPGESPHTNDPPFYKTELFWSGFGCALASAGVIVFFLGGTSAIVASGGVLTPAVIAGAVVAGASWGAACGVALNEVSDPGYYGASGSYVNCWGCDENTAWTGQIIDLPGIISIDTNIAITDPEMAPAVPYGNAAPYAGYYEQKEAYQEMDREVRHAAWGAHNEFREQVGNANAGIMVNIPLLGTATGLAGDVVYFIATTPAGDLLYDLEAEQLILACPSVCSGEAVLTITSGGTGTLTPGDPVQLNFAGSPGEAEVSILGVTFSGLTLTGEMGGEGTTQLGGINPGSN